MPLFDPNSLLFYYNTLLICSTRNYLLALGNMSKTWMGMSHLADYLRQQMSTKWLCMRQTLSLLYECCLLWKSSSPAQQGVLCVNDCLVSQRPLAVRRTGCSSRCVPWLIHWTEHACIWWPSQFLKAPQWLALQINSFSMLPSICQNAAVCVTSVKWFTQNLKQNSSRSFTWKKAWTCIYEWLNKWARTINIIIHD